MERTPSTAIYVRVSTNHQNTAGQVDDLKRWVKSQRPEELGDVQWFEEFSSGNTMGRPEWEQVEQLITTRQITTLVCWRIDRLGRTTQGLCELFTTLKKYKVNLVSIRDSVDLSTPAGRLMARVIASIAEYETEVRRERIKAGMRAKNRNGEVYKRKKKYSRRPTTPIQVINKAKKLYHEKQLPIADIARACRLKRETVYRLLGLGQYSEERAEQYDAENFTKTEEGPL
jgi:DNA invertase Pin-like site-specific DNA recombinase